MKFNRIITVLLLSAVCMTSQQTTNVSAHVTDTVVSNQSTIEDDNVECALEQLEVTSVASVVSGTSVVSGQGIEAFTGEMVTLKTKLAASGVSKEIIKTEEKKSTKKKKRTVKKYTAKELKLMSCIIYCEAQGEPYAGKMAVGIVVANRKSSKLFPNTIKGVIYQKYQFGPTRNGSMAKALKMYEAGKFNSSSAKACIKAAKAVLNGTKKVTYRSKTYNLSNYHYFSTKVKNARLRIKHHQFK